MAKASKTQRAHVRKILDSAMEGKLIDASMPIRDAMRQLGPDIDEVAGYVLAWEKYVLVIGSDDVVIDEQLDRA